MKKSTPVRTIIGATVLMVGCLGGFLAGTSDSRHSAAAPGIQAELASFGLTSSGPATSQPAPGIGPTVKPVVFTGSLAKLPVLPPFKGVSQPPPDPAEGSGKGAGSLSSTLPRTTPARPQVTLPGSTGALVAGSSNFDTIPNVSGVYPPDPSGDIGISDYVQTANDAIAVFSRSGVPLAGPTSSSSMWAAAGAGGLCATNAQGDGTARYDRWADRFVVTNFAFAVSPSDEPLAPFDECIAVSKTGDPVGGGWFLYDVRISNGTFNDFPKFGLWPDGYYVTFNMKPGTGQGAVFAFNRAKMLAGLPANSVCFGCDSDGFSRLGGDDNLLPADSDGVLPPPLGTPETLVRFSSPLIGAQSLQQWTVHVDWRHPLNSTLAQLPDVGVPAFNDGVGLIPEPGSTLGFDSLSDRLSNRAVYVNRGNSETLLLNHTVVEPVAGGGSTAGLRWYQLARDQQSIGSGPPLSFQLRQSGDFAPDALNRWVGSIAMDRGGDIGLGYSVSGVQRFPSIVAAGRKATDPSGQITEGEVTLLAGGGFQLPVPGARNRWGDYTSLNLDPVDNCTFWYTNEYLLPGASPGNNAPWQVHVGTFSFDGCQNNPTATTLDPPPVSVLFGSPVALTAHVVATTPGAPTPTGVVTFFNGAAELGSAIVQTDGSATLTTAAMLPAGHSITATYVGSGTFEPSSASARTTVVKCATTINGSSSALTISTGSVCLTGTFLAVHITGGAVAVVGATTGDLDARHATAIAICGSHLGTVTLTDTQGLTEVGDATDDGPPACGANHFPFLFVSGSTRGVEVGGNTATFPSGLMVLIANGGGEPAPDDVATEVEGNSAFAIVCLANSPSVGNGGIGNHPTIDVPLQQCSGL